ncbi:putative ankyrin protein [Purpureocillium lavendulum]|uniref:Ankyrin protein n=1 Tax=Purpureocillium lavendulum TaxID=1247861 RepID=A0AB34G4C3_9HYPO|nr:putative ankyrin protein [Purpureocillium lavendulum]
MIPAVLVCERQADGRFVPQGSNALEGPKPEICIVDFLAKRLPLSLPILRTIQFGAGVRNNALLCTVSLPPQDSTRDAETRKDAASFGADDVWTIALIDRDNHPGTEIWPFSSLELHRNTGSSADPGPCGTPLEPGDIELPLFSPDILQLATRQLHAILSKVPEPRHNRGLSGQNTVLMGNVHTTLAALLARAGLVASHSPPYGKYIFSAKADPVAVANAPDGSSEGLPQGLAWGVIRPDDHATILAQHERMSVEQLNELPSVVVREAAEHGQDKAIAYAFTGRDGAVSTLDAYAEAGPGKATVFGAKKNRHSLGSEASMFITKDDPRLGPAIAAIYSGDVDALSTHLSTDPALATLYVGSASEARTLLHILADWPGHLPRAPDTARALVAAGAAVNAPFVGEAHSETPLHWAASNDDVALLDALLDAGADIDAPGGVIAETPLADARAFRQLKTAKRLVERGARVTLQDAASLGLQDRVEAFVEPAWPPREDINCALWNACHGGQLKTAQYLYLHGGEINFVAPWEELTPLDAARRSDAADVVSWLEGLGALTFQKSS